MLAWVSGVSGENGKDVLPHLKYPLPSPLGRPDTQAKSMQVERVYAYFKQFVPLRWPFWEK